MTEFLYGYDEERDDDRPSKSQRKRDMIALQKLGEKLLVLTPDQLRRMELPDELIEAVWFYQTLKEKEARRRQQQRVGVIMRGLDAEPIRQALDRLDQGRLQQTESFHQVEVWRDQLVAGDEDLLAELAIRFELEERQLHQMVRAAAAEKASGQPSRQGRALFRLLRTKYEGEASLLKS